MVQSRKNVDSGDSESDYECDESEVENSKQTCQKLNVKRKERAVKKSSTKKKDKNVSFFESSNSSSDSEEKLKRSKKAVIKNKLSVDSDCNSSDDFESTSDYVQKDKRNEKSSESEETNDESESSESSDNEIVVSKTKKRNTRKRKNTPDTSDDDDGDDYRVKKKAKRTKKTDKKKSSPSKTKSGRKEIRTVLKKGQLTEETKDAEKQERERRKRLQKSKENKIVEVDLDDTLNTAVPLPITKRLVLQKEPLVEVHSHITVHLKPHQVEGIQFIWDNLIETTEQAQKGQGGGCILAHCMGLGKTLQTITILHTILTSEHLSFKTALVVAPLNTLLNWINEFNNWMPEESRLTLYNLNEYQTIRSRLDALRKWRKTGGVMVLGYDMFRLLASGARIRYKQWKTEFAQLLLDPGPDIVVCDEGHKLKNSESNISVIMCKIKTFRRIALTGTPLQNNLMEYQCMVNFVKPNLLGSVKEFRNRFVNPIQNGQHSDSTPLDVRLMKKRCHVLHNMLRGFVQRKDYTALAKYLCEKREYIIKVRLTPLQIQLYRLYLDKQTNRGSNPYAVTYGARDTGLFADYQNLMRIWTHPRVLRLHTIRQENMSSFLDDETSEDALSSEEEQSDTDDEKEKKSRANNGEIPDANKSDTKEKEKLRKKRSFPCSDESSASVSETEEEESSDESDFEVKSDDEEEDVKVKRVRYGGKYKLRGGLSEDEKDDSDKEKEANQAPVVDDNSWYSSIYKEHSAEFENIESGGKLAVLFELLHLAKQCDDKVLVFSQSLLSLDLIEEMLALSTGKAVALEEEGSADENSNSQKWYKNVDYFRIDGSSLSKARQKWINAFNDEEDRRARLFLISTKAGSLGVNLVAANRVVIFDASWNPTHDIQSIFRVYRFGQTKSCYIYRLIAQGTMEEKIYDRQVTKQSLSFRVVDEQQINRYFTAHDLQELYYFTPSEPPKEGEPGHALPQDKLLAELLVGIRTKDLISSYHKHDSLLDHQEEEELTEEERKAAWEEYEKEKQGIRVKVPAAPTTTNVPVPNRVPPNDLLKAMGFYQRQMMLQQQLRQQKQDVLKNNQAAVMDKISQSVSENSRKAMFSQLLKLSDEIAAAKKKIEERRPLDISQTVRELKQLPMYAHMREDGLKLLAFEINMRRQLLRRKAEEELEKLQSRMQTVNASYQSLVNQSETSRPSFSAASLPTFSLMNKDAERSLSSSAFASASSFARSSFHDMLKNHGLNASSLGSTASTSSSNNDTKAVSNSAETDLQKLKNDDSSSPVVAIDLSKDAVLKDTKSKSNPSEISKTSYSISNITFQTLKNSAEASKSSAGAAENSTEAIKNSAETSNNAEPSKNNVFGPSKIESKSKMDLEPKVLLTPVEASQTLAHKVTKKKKPKKAYSSDEEFVVTDEEDDWEAAYLQKAKSRSRRARN